MARDRWTKANSSAWPSRRCRNSSGAASGIDADCGLKRTGVLEIEFGNGSKIIVNSQAAAREIWVAPKSGGYHFRGNTGRWVNTRDSTELFCALSVYVSQQAGETVNLVLGKV